MKRYVVDGGTAVLTGAAGGIGRAVALELSARGSSLVLLDRDAEGLDELADRIRRARPDRDVSTYAVDLADGAATLAVATAIREAHPHVDLLVNNAGVALAGRFDQLGLDDIDWLMAVNLRAVLVMTHTLLPSLVSAPGSHIVTMSSLFGLVAPGGQSAYSASKFAVRGLSDSLRQELAPYGVGVTTVHPGGIATGIARSARTGPGVSEEERALGQAVAARLLTIDPAVAARRIVDGAERRRPRVLIGLSAYALDVLARVAPGSYGALLRRLDDEVARRVGRGLDRGRTPPA